MSKNIKDLLMVMNNCKYKFNLKIKIFKVCISFINFKIFVILFRIF